MNKEYREWLRRCIYQPDKYRIVVDNDSQWVEHIESCECIYDLCINTYGWELAIELLNFMGCNAESV